MRESRSLRLKNNGCTRWDFKTWRWYGYSGEGVYTAIVVIFTTATLHRMCLLTGVCLILGRTFPARGALVTVHYVGKRLLWFWKSFFNQQFELIGYNIDSNTIFGCVNPPNTVKFVVMLRGSPFLAWLFRLLQRGFTCLHILKAQGAEMAATLLPSFIPFRRLWMVGQELSEFSNVIRLRPADKGLVVLLRNMNVGTQMVVTDP